MKIRNSKFKIRNWLLVISLLVILSGCARTVTERVPFGKELTVEYNLASSVDLSNKYYVVFSTNSDYQVPLSPYEFIEPGIPPTHGNINEYFVDYYSKWSGYVILDSGNYYLVKGPFISTTEAYQHIKIGSFSGGSKVSFTFRLDELFPTPPLPTIYFDFVTVDSGNFLRDHLIGGKYITPYEGIIVTGSDEGDSAISGSLDILNWIVTIQ